MAADTARSPARRSERARQAILAAATDLIAERGYARLSVEAIAARAGVGKQTIYRWWPSKAAVVFDAFLALQVQEEGLELPDSGDLATDLTSLLRGTVAALAESPAESAYRALIGEIQHDAELSAELHRRLLGPNLEATKRRLASAQSAGQIGAGVDLDVAVELLFGPIFHRWLLRTAPMDDAYADAVAALVLAALAPPAGAEPVR